MANQEQVEILKSGAKEWNAWRSKNWNEKIDLIGIKLNGTNLRNANLSNAYLNYSTLIDVNLRESNLRNTNLNLAKMKGVNLISANLIGSNLTSAKLIGANLRSASLIGSDLRGVNLSTANLKESRLVNANLWNAYLMDSNLMGADLRGARLINVDLRGADLSNANLTSTDLESADLRYARFSYANLTKTNLSNSKLDQTTFAFQNLSTCKGLNSVVVRGKCIIDYETLTTSRNLPKSFLKKMGLPELYIDYIPEFRDSSPIKLFPVFLSHSWANKDFAGKLYNTLIDKNVQVWYDEKKMRPGDDILESISKGIGVYDKTLLVCSKDSLESWWVKREVNRLFEKERKYQKENKSDMGLLIPITIDDYLYKAESGLANAIKERVVGDFTQWKEPEVFNREVQKLVDALNVDRKDRDPLSLLK